MAAKKKAAAAPASESVDEVEVAAVVEDIDSMASAAPEPAAPVATESVEIPQTPAPAAAAAVEASPAASRSSTPKSAKRKGIPAPAAAAAMEAAPAASRSSTPQSAKRKASSAKGRKGGEKAAAQTSDGGGSAEGAASPAAALAATPASAPTELKAPASSDDLTPALASIDLNADSDAALATPVPDESPTDEVDAALEVSPTASSAAAIAAADFADAPPSAPGDGAWAEELPGRSPSGATDGVDYNGVLPPPKVKVHAQKLKGNQSKSAAERSRGKKKGKRDAERAAKLAAWNQATASLYGHDGASSALVAFPTSPSDSDAPPPSPPPPESPAAPAATALALATQQAVVASAHARGKNPMALATHASIGYKILLRDLAATGVAESDPDDGTPVDAYVAVALLEMSAATLRMKRVSTARTSVARERRMSGVTSTAANPAWGPGETLQLMVPCGSSTAKAMLGGTMPTVRITMMDEDEGDDDVVATVRCTLSHGLPCRRPCSCPSPCAMHHAAVSSRHAWRRAVACTVCWSFAKRVPWRSHPWRR